MLSSINNSISNLWYGNVDENPVHNNTTIETNDSNEDEYVLVEPKDVLEAKIHTYIKINEKSQEILNSPGSLEKIYNEKELLWENFDKRVKHLLSDKHWDSATPPVSMLELFSDIKSLFNARSTVSAESAKLDKKYADIASDRINLAELNKKCKKIEAFESALIDAELKAGNQPLTETEKENLLMELALDPMKNTQVIKQMEEIDLSNSQKSEPTTLFSKWLPFA